MPDLELRLNKDVLTVAPLITWQLLDLDVDDNECLEYLNILDDELIQETHRRYKLAGANCTPTNTLRANRTALQQHGLADALVDINRRGVRLAREAGFEHILATVGLADPEVLSEQVAALLSENPDALWLVGEAEADELNAAISSIKAQTSLPLIAAAARESSKTADAASANAPSKTERADIIYAMGKPLQESLEELRSMLQRYTEPLMICPSINTPEGATEKQRTMALNQLIDDMADFTLEARALGAQFIGTAPGSSPVLTGSASVVLNYLPYDR